MPNTRFFFHLVRVSQIIEDHHTSLLSIKGKPSFIWATFQRNTFDGGAHHLWTPLTVTTTTGVGHLNTPGSGTA